MKDYKVVDEPKTYLLRKIIYSHQNGGKLGSLNAKYIDELSSIMLDFAKDTISAMLPALNDGKQVIIDDGFIVEIKGSNQPLSTSR